MPHCWPSFHTVARLISEMTLSGLSMKCPSDERTRVGGLRNAGSSCQMNCSTLARSPSSLRSATRSCRFVLRDGQLHGLHIERRSDPRQRFLKHQHHE